VPLHRQALFDRQVDLVAGGVDAVDGATGLALELVVVEFFQAGAAGVALHLEGEQVLAGKSSTSGVGGDARRSEGVRGGGVVGIVTRAGRVDLERGGDGQALDEPRIFLRSQVVEEDVGQEQGLVDVAVELGGADFSVRLRMKLTWSR